MIRQDNQKRKAALLRPTTSCILQYFPNNSFCNSQERNEAESFSTKLFVSKQTFQWYCIFHSYEYFFFVIYVIQSAFIGNGLELLKSPLQGRANEAVLERRGVDALKRTSHEPSLHSVEATLANEIKTTNESKSVAFNEVEISLNYLHLGQGRASSEPDKKQTHLGGFFSISDEAILERRKRVFSRLTIKNSWIHIAMYIAALIKEITTNELVIEGIQFVYDVRGMKEFKDDFVLDFNAEKFCLDYLDEYDESFELRPYRFGQWLGLLGAFITFRTESMARSFRVWLATDFFNQGILVSMVQEFGNRFILQSLGKIVGQLFLFSNDHIYLIKQMGKSKIRPKASPSKSETTSVETFS
uniref:Uncharacterized protein n=1 Tax=Tetranychus urticae TaxID=32264 RepID=T1JWA5_TETUR